jgi:hypothetical protein
MKHNGEKADTQSHNHFTASPLAGVSFYKLHSYDENTLILFMSSLLRHHAKSARLGLNQDLFLTRKKILWNQLNSEEYKPATPTKFVNKHNQ